jgi:hypothetical protein
MTYKVTTSAPPPRPWIIRPTMNTNIVGAVPATTMPPVKSKTPRTNGRTGPIRSHTSPARIVANMLAVMKPENAHA